MKVKRPAGQAPRRTVDQDGVVRVELRQGASLRWILIGGLAAVAALAALGFAIWPRPEPPPAPGAGQRPAGQASQAKAAARREFRMQLTKRAEPGGTPEAEPGAEPRPGPPSPSPSPSPSLSPLAGAGTGEPSPGSDPEPEPEAAEPDAPEEPQRTGIAGMPLHGTKKIKVGIVVPPDYPLPEGYVRHHQTTDRGQMLDAILMFHPDYEPVDAQGNPIPMPEDRVVPPDLAPPGLPSETLEVPDDAYTEPGETDEPSEGEADPDPEEGEADPAP